MAWVFRDVRRESLADPPAVRIQPAYVLRDGASGRVDVVLTVSVPALRRRFDAELTLHPAEPATVVLSPDLIPTAGGPYEVRAILEVAERAREGGEGLVVFDRTHDRLGVERAGISLVGPKGSALANLGAALLGIGLQAAIVAALAVLGSTFLSEWVSAFFAVGLAVAGRSLDLLRAFAAAPGGALAGGHAHAHEHAHALGPEPAQGPIAAAVQWLADLFARAIPDLARLDLADLAAAGARIPATVVAEGALYAAAYVLPALLVAWVVFRRKEAVL